jgi:hypothetical protein
MERRYEEDMQEPLPSYQPSYRQTPTGKGKGADIWSGDGAQQDHTTAHHFHSIHPTTRHGSCIDQSGYQHLERGRQ